jgi:hypothetical protein
VVLRVVNHVWYGKNLLSNIKSELNEAVYDLRQGVRKVYQRALVIVEGSLKT